MCEYTCLHAAEVTAPGSHSSKAYFFSPANDLDEEGEAIADELSGLEVPPRLRRYVNMKRI